MKKLQGRTSYVSYKSKLGIVLLVIACIATAVLWWRHDAPRRDSLTALTRVETALNSGNRAELLTLVVIPAAVRDRTAPEQSEFLAEALNDEISPEGLAELKQRGAFGPLQKLFPAEAEAWTKQAGVNPDNCVAFKLERHGIRTEVVLVRPSARDAPYRVLRLNNVRPLADSAALSTTEKQP